MVVFAHAIVDPWAVMVETRHAQSAHTPIMQAEHNTLHTAQAQAQAHHTTQAQYITPAHHTAQAHCTPDKHNAHARHTPADCAVFGSPWLVHQASRTTAQPGITRV